MATYSARQILLVTYQSVAARVAPSHRGVLPLNIANSIINPSNKPIIAGLTPVPNATLLAGDAIQFELVDPDNDLALVVLIAEFSAHSEVIYSDGDWGYLYDQGSSVIDIPNGKGFSVVRNGGWLEPPTLVIHNLDRRGNQVEYGN